MRVEISNENLFVVSGSLSISSAIKERSTCGFIARVFENNTSHFKKGQPVEVYNNSDELIFGGVISTCKESGATKSGGLDFAIDCVGNTYLASKRIVARAYVKKTAGYIVRDILSEYLEDEGVVEGTIDEGPTIKEVVFNYIYADAALDILSEKTGFWWDISNDKHLYFVPNETYEAPVDLTWDITLKGSVSVEHGNPKYRNTQYLTDCKEIMQEAIQEYSGDNDTKAFTVGYPIANTPKIEVARWDSLLQELGAYTEEIVGVKGLHQGTKQWYFAYNDPIVVQDDVEITLTDQDRIRITFRGLYDLVVKNVYPQEILKFKDLEVHGSGKVDDVKSKNIRGLEAAIDASEELLHMYATDGTMLSYQTEKSGISAGMIQTVNLPEHGIVNKSFLITSVNASEDNDTLTYSVTAVQGPVSDDWANFFVQEEKSSISIFEGVSEEGLVQVLLDFYKTWQESEHPNIFSAPIYPSETLFPSDTLFPTLNSADPIKYIAWYVDGDEVGRSKVVKQYITDGQVKSVGFISQEVVVELISHIGWVGGALATEEIGTGILLDKQVLNREKTRLEVFQVEKTDTKGWDNGI